MQSLWGQPPRGHPTGWSVPIGDCPRFALALGVLISFGLNSILPPSAWALRTETPTQSGVEEILRQELAPDQADLEEADRILKEFARDEIDGKLRKLPYGYLRLIELGSGIRIEQAQASNTIFYRGFAEVPSLPRPEGYVCPGAADWIAVQLHERFQEAGVPVEVAVKKLSSPVWMEDYVVQVKYAGGVKLLSATPGMPSLFDPLPQRGQIEEVRHPIGDTLPLYKPEEPSADFPMAAVVLDEHNAIYLNARVVPRADPKAGPKEPLLLTYSASILGENYSLVHPTQFLEVSIPKERLRAIRDNLRAHPELRDKMFKTLQSLSSWDVQMQHLQTGMFGLSEQHKARLEEEFKRHPFILYVLLTKFEEWPKDWDPAPPTARPPVVPAAGLEERMTAQAFGEKYGDSLILSDDEEGARVKEWMGRADVQVTVRDLPNRLPLYVKGDRVFWKVVDELKAPPGLVFMPILINLQTEFRKFGLILKDPLFDLTEAEQAAGLEVVDVRPEDVPKLDPIQLVLKILGAGLESPQTKHLGAFVFSYRGRTKLVDFSA